MFSRNSSRLRKGAMSSSGEEIILPFSSLREVSFGAKGWARSSITSQHWRAVAFQRFARSSAAAPAWFAQRRKGKPNAAAILPKVGKAEARVGPATDDVVGEKIGLRLADGMIAAIVEDENFDRQIDGRAMVCSSCRFIMMLPSPARQMTRCLPPQGDGRAERGGKVVAHRRAAGIVIKPLARV